MSNASEYNLNDSLNKIQKKKNFSLNGKLQKPYFVVSKNKLIFMSLISFGLYDIYWFYKNWWVIAENTKKEISPVFRALFFEFTAYWCLKNINNSAAEIEDIEPLKYELFAVGYLISFIVSWLPDPYWIFYLFTIFIIVKVNNFARKVNEELFPEFDISSDYTTRNWVLVTVGILLWLFNIPYFYQKIL